MKLRQQRFWVAALLSLSSNSVLGAPTKKKDKKKLRDGLQKKFIENGNLLDIRPSSKTNADGDTDLLFGEQGILPSAKQAREGMTGISASMKEFVNEIRGRVGRARCLRDVEEPAIADCDDYENVVEFLFQRTKWNICNSAGQPDADYEAIITESFDAWAAICVESPEAERRLSERGRRKTQANQFCPTRFEEGTYGGRVPVPPAIGDLEGRQNQYGWGANFNEQCNVGVLIHSGGTAAFSTNEYSLPTFTLRNGAGQILFEGIYTEGALPQFGIRSAEIVACEGDIITVIGLALGKPDGFFVRFDLDISQYNGEPVFGVTPTYVEPTVSPSVRASRVLESNNSTILFAPLFDLGGFAGGARLRIFDWVERKDMGNDIILLSDTGKPLKGFIWDFECANEGLCYVNTISSLPNERVDGSQGVKPELFLFPLSQVENLSEGETVRILTNRVPILFDFPYSALSLEVINQDQVVACTLSGFAFRVAFVLNVFAEGLLDVRRRRQLRGAQDKELLAAVERKLEKVDRNLQVIFFGINKTLRFFELAFGQECNICDRDSCKNIPFNGLTTASTYVWQVTECDDKVFAAILDFSSQFSDQFLVFTLEEIVAFACEFNIFFQLLDRIGDRDTINTCQFVGNDALRRYLRTFSGRRIRLQSIAASVAYQDDIDPDDFGFDLFFAPTQDVLNGNAVFQPITTNGFRELSPSPSNGRPPANFPFDFDPFSEVDDGIRTMRCYSDDQGNANLVLGTAVFGLNQASNTYVLDLKNGC